MPGTSCAYTCVAGPMVGTKTNFRTDAHTTETKTLYLHGRCSLQSGPNSVVPLLHNYRMLN